MNVKIETRCPKCRKRRVLEVNKAAYEAWRGGALIQLAFPGLTSEQREWLMTGYDKKCWDESFPDE